MIIGGLLYSRAGFFEEVRVGEKRIRALVAKPKVITRTTLRRNKRFIFYPFFVLRFMDEV